MHPSHTRCRYVYRPMIQQVPQPQFRCGSAACANFAGSPPKPHWRLAAKLMTLGKTLITPLQTVLDTELYKAEVLLNWANAEELRNRWTREGICVRMARWRHEEGCGSDPPCALEGCTRQRQYPDGFDWDRCCKACLNTEGSVHEHWCDEDLLFDQLARTANGRAPRTDDRARGHVVRGG